MGSFARRTVRQERSLILGFLVVAALWFAIPDGSSRLRASSGPTISVPGFAITQLANLSSSQVSLAIPPPALVDDLGSDLYAAVVTDDSGPFSYSSNPIVRIYSNGSVSVFEHLASFVPYGLELPPPDADFADEPYFFLSTHWMNSAVARAQASFDGFLVGPSIDGFVPGGLTFATTPGNTSLFMTVQDFGIVDALDGSNTTGLIQDNGPWIDIDFDETNVFATPPGGRLYAANGDEIDTFAQTGDPDAPFSNVPVSFALVPGGGGIRALEFARGGSFGNGLYVGTSLGEIHRYTPGVGGPTWQLFATGFDGASIDGIEFSYDGTTMYVADADGKVYKITAVVNTPPTALCQNVTVTTDPGVCTAASASIDNGSFDAEGSVSLNQTPAGPYALGNTSVALTVTDLDDATASCSATVTVVDQEYPTITSASASPANLWPANQSLVPVSISVTAGDNCSVSCSITSVTSNEPVGGGPGDPAPDWQVTGPLTLNLRAQRLGSGSGRTYTVGLSCSDGSGNTATSSVQVKVPHDQGKKK